MYHCKLPMDRAIRVALIGAGGNGAQMAAGIAQISVALQARGGLPLAVYVYDDDRVSHANVGRQLFSPADVGRFKSDVIVERTNWFYGFNWSSIPERVGKNSRLDQIDIFVTAVDTAKSRVDIEKAVFFNAYHTKYLLDVGNRTQSGQVVLGAYCNGVYELPTLRLLFPEINDENFNEQDQGPSCSLAEALQKQDLFVNRDVTTGALHILWDVISKRNIEVHGAFTSLETMRRSPLKVDRQTWLRMNPNIEEFLTPAA
ncbi:PRTRC system ThiF family protein [Acidithiobacillus thiooxidans]|jgi:PRTRC genetic system ThiF family protein|uniref:PRTRC system ThiF family protein n=2 Tax=Acidithiobacillus TaxID=119977 RepID=UPI00068A1498|nr:PRTRC system ThiF family protein [Acidithiobacillus thiooxidans]